MIDYTAKKKICEFISLYKDYYCDETSKKIFFEEVIQIKDIDQSAINNAPESSFIKITFFDYLKDEELLSIHSAQQLREVNGENYLHNSKKVKILTTVNKEILISHLSYENKYSYFNLDSFIKGYPNLKWKNVDHKMFVFLINDESINFQSDFLHIQSLNEKTSNLSEEISKYFKERYLSFNDIYSSIYDDKKLSSYFEFPLTWFCNDNFESTNMITYQMIVHFFNIICNKKIGDTKYLIRGHKTITVDLSIVAIPDEVSEVVKDLFEFILDIDKHHDKLSLLRNTMTIFLDSQSNELNFFEKSEEILKAVKYNFDLYIQDKVRLFLDQKNKLLQEFITTAKKIEDLTNGLISQMRTVSLSLLGTIFLSLLNDLNRGNTHAIINIVLLSYISFFAVNLVIVISQVHQKDSLTSSLKEYTKSLGGIEGSEDKSLSYNSLEKDYLEEPLAFFCSYRKWMIVGLSILIGLFVIVYLSYRFKFFSAPIDIIKFIVGY